MKRPSYNVELRLLAVEMGTPSPFAKVRATIGEHSILIRWGVDEFTYPHLKRAFQTRGFNSMLGLGYEYFIAHKYSIEPPKQNSRRLSAALECRLGRDSTMIWFTCSEWYVSNIEWFRTNSVTSLDQLEHLRWENNLPDGPGVFQ
jgi:hypothetical protein